MPSQQLCGQCHLCLEEVLGMAVLVVFQVGNVSLAARAGLGVGARVVSGEAEMACPQVPC